MGRYYAVRRAMAGWSEADFRADLARLMVVSVSPSMRPAPPDVALEVARRLRIGVQRHGFVKHARDRARAEAKRQGVR